MDILKNFIKEYKSKYTFKKIEYEDGLIGDIHKTSDALFQKIFTLPSKELSLLLDK